MSPTSYQTAPPRNAVRFVAQVVTIRTAPTFVNNVKTTPQLTQRGPHAGPSATLKAGEELI